MTDVWLTPLTILDALGGAASFDLDPCAALPRPWPTAINHYTRADNGLTRRWFGRVWCNPPYGRTIGRWLGRMAAHNRGIALINARTETAVFFRDVWGVSTALLFVRGRIAFVDETGEPVLRKSGKPQTGDAPSVLVAYGRSDADVLAGCGIDGAFVPLRLSRSIIVTCLDVDQTWRQSLVGWLRAHRGPVSLADLYRAFATHPKARRNPNWQAKIRQTLQLGPFRQISRGQWQHDSREQSA